MVTIGDRKKARGDIPSDCQDTHDWLWINQMKPQIKNIIIGSICAVGGAALVASAYIADYKVNASEHATKTEVKEVEAELKYVLHEVRVDLQSDIDNLNQMHQEGFERMEDKMDDMMKLLMTHDKNGAGN